MNLLSNFTKKTVQLFLVCFLAPLFIVSCGSSEPPPPTATPIPPTPTPDPAAIVRGAGAAMSDLESVRFEISRTGGPAYVDENDQFILNEAIGLYSAPTSAIAELDVSGLGLNIKVQTIAIGEEQWLTNFLTQQWEKLPENIGFNPADIFGPEGFEALLDENVTDVSPMRIENIEEAEFTAIDVVVEGDRVSAITAGAAASDQPVELTVWLDRATSRIHQIQFETPSPTDVTAKWLLKFGQFNEPVTIEPPVQ